MQRKVFVFACALLLLTASIVMRTHANVGRHMPQHSAGAHRHAEAAKLTNPVQPTPESIAAGKKLYGKHCEECHGSAGKGDGMKADEYDPKPANLSDAEWEHGSSDGELFTVVRDGLRKTDMKAFGSKMSAKDIWTVVTYVRTFGSKAAVR